MAPEGSWSCDLPTWTVRPSWTTGPIVASRTALIVPGAYDAARTTLPPGPSSTTDPSASAAAMRLPPGPRPPAISRTGLATRDLKNAAPLGPRNRRPGRPRTDALRGCGPDDDRRRLVDVARGEAQLSGRRSVGVAVHLPVANVAAAICDPQRPPRRRGHGGDAAAVLGPALLAGRVGRPAPEASRCPRARRVPLRRRLTDGVDDAQAGDRERDDAARPRHASPGGERGRRCRGAHREQEQHGEKNSPPPAGQVEPNAKNPCARGW